MLAVRGVCRVTFGVSRQAIRRALSGPTFFSRTLPAALLALLLLVGLVTVFAQAGQYGIAIDETLQDPYGAAALKFYATLGRNTSFLTLLPPESHLPEHGRGYRCREIPPGLRPPGHRDCAPG